MIETNDLSMMWKAMAIILAAILSSIWFYVLARLISWGIMKSWSDFTKQTKNNKEKRDE